MASQDDDLAQLGRRRWFEEHEVKVEALSRIVELRLLERYWRREAVYPAPERLDLTPVVDRMIDSRGSVAALMPKKGATSARYARQLQPRFDGSPLQLPRLHERLPDDAGAIARTATHVPNTIVRMTDGKIYHLGAELRRVNDELPSADDLSVEFSVHFEVGAHYIEVSGRVDATSGLIDGLLAVVFA